MIYQFQFINFLCLLGLGDTGNWESTYIKSKLTWNQIWPVTCIYESSVIFHVLVFFCWVVSNIFFHYMTVKTLEHRRQFYHQKTILSFRFLMLSLFLMWLDLFHLGSSSNRYIVGTHWDIFRRYAEVHAKRNGRSSLTRNMFSLLEKSCKDAISEKKQ